MTALGNLERPVSTAGKLHAPVADAAPAHDAPASPDDSGYEEMTWRGELFGLPLDTDPLLPLLPELSSPPKGWNWDALEGLPRSGELGGAEPGGSRVVQSGWAPVSAAPAYAAAVSPACAPVRVTVTSAAVPAPAPMLHAALPSGSLAALNAWRAAAGGAPPRPPSQALPFGAVSQRFHPTTPPANAWRLRAEAFGAPAAPPAPAPSAPAAPAPQPPAPVRVLRSKRKRAGRGRTQDADYVFYDEDEAPPALRGQRRAGARESPDAAGEERDALAGRAVSERPEPLGKQRQRAAGGGTASVAAPAGVGPVTPAAPAVLPAAAGGKQARPPAAEVARAYQEHEVVWARLPGFPWWPAQVQPARAEHLAAARRPGELLCVFYGQGDYAWLPRSQVRPFACAEYDARAARKDAGLQSALAAAWDALGMGRPAPDASGKVQLPFELDAPVIPYDEERSDS